MSKEVSKEVSKEISSKYKVLTDIEHVLHRPSTYIGSTKQQTSDEFVYENNKIQRKSVTYNPAFLKIFDEILTNAVDESKRNKNLNTIVVTVTDDTITVKDNGGIPVIQHTQHKKWIPELIFSQLRSGSNFDDSEDRIVAGTNGLGSTLTNIFSKTFIVKTADGQKQFLQTFSDNMSHRSAVKITDSPKNFTEISYVPDFKYFGLSKIDEDHYLLLKKRVLDIAACNIELKITFNNERFRFKTFKEYADLYVNNPEDGSTVTTWNERSENWEIAVGYSAVGYETISFVNSNETKDGGTHVAHITNQIVEKLRLLIKKKHKVEIKPGDIKNHIMLFVNCTIINPSFSSQTKEKLITEPKDFGSSHDVSDKLIKNIFASEVVASILDWIQRKQEADLNSKIRKLNKDVSNVKILKLIDAKARTHREQCSLGLFEGDCLHEDTLITVLDEANGIRNIKIKDSKPGMYVITHENKLKRIISKSEKISKLIEIKTKYGIIKASKLHKFYVYNTNNDTFEWVKVADLNITIHKMVKNKLNSITKAVSIKDISYHNEENLKFILTDGQEYITTNTHKWLVYDLFNETFDMKFTIDVKKEIDLIIFT